MANLKFGFAKLVKGEPKMRFHFIPILLLFFLAACSSEEVNLRPVVNETETSKPDKPAKPVQQPTVSPPPAAHPPQASATVDSVSPPEIKEYYVDMKNFRIHPKDKDSKEKIVLLTFDDGPKGKVTLQILDILDKYQAKSIWFINGFNYGWDYKASPEKAENFKALVKEIHRRGHIVANHTWEHENLRKLSPDKQRKEILSMNELLTDITGEKVKYFRPPFGAYSDIQKQLMVDENMQSINWSVGSLDWEHKEPQKVVDQVVSTIHNGGNILMHDLPVTAEALDPLLKKLKEMGYSFVLPTEVQTE